MMLWCDCLSEQVPMYSIGQRQAHAKLSKGGNVRVCPYLQAEEHHISLSTAITLVSKSNIKEH